MSRIRSLYTPADREKEWEMKRERERERESKEDTV